MTIFIDASLSHLYIVSILLVHGCSSAGQSQDVVPGLAAFMAPGNFSGMQITSPHPDLLNRELGSGGSDLCFNKILMLVNIEVLLF